MRLLFLDQFSDLGGAQLCMRDLIPEIERRRWQAHFMAPGDGALAQFFRSKDLPTRCAPLGTYKNGQKSIGDVLRFGVDMTRMASEVKTLARRHGIDLVYVNGPRVLAAAAGTSRPVLFHVHSYLHKNYARAIAGWCLRRTRATVIAASRFVTRPLEEIVPGQSIHVVYNGVEDQRFAPRFERKGPIVIGMIGRIAPEKGQVDFVQAAKKLASTRSDIRFVVVGSALFADRRYEELVRSIAALAPVEFRGWTDNVSEALHGMDILAVPSGPHEAATRVIMEAFSAGTPVVAYPSGGIPEVARDGETALLTDAPDFESLGGKIETLIRNPDLMHRLSYAGRQEWQRRFTVERFRRDVCDRIESALADSPMRAATAGNFE